MVLRFLLVTIVLLTPTVAQTPPIATPFAIRACIQQGTHGSVANLSEAEIVAPTPLHASRRTLYWFAQNLAGFKDHVGQKVEISATVNAVLDEARQFQATDGVFAEVEVKSQTVDDPKPVVATGSPAPLDRPVATSGEDAPDHPVVMKATVTGLRMVGLCR